MRPLLRGRDTDDQATETRSIVRGSDIVRALPGLAPDVPMLARGGYQFATLRPASRRSVGLAFQQLAGRRPDRPFLRFEGADLTYGQANARVNQYAAVLAARGVGPGSVVGVLSTNRPETLLVALAVVKLGAVAGLLNHHQRGAVLGHSLQLLQSRVLVVGAECREALESLPSPVDRDSILVLPDDDVTLDGFPDLDAAADAAGTENPATCARVRADSSAFYVFTSGTTGLPKASTMSHLRWLKAMAALGHVGVRLKSTDTVYCCLPLYHNNALTVSLSSVIAAGATLAIGRSFSASRFWDRIRENDATAFCYIGELCRYLLNQPSGAGDRDHRVRVVLGNGLRPEIWTAFQERFGIGRIAEFYGASESNVAFFNAFNLEGTVGLCPLPFAVVAVDPVTAQAQRDERGHLRRVAVGETGLLITQITGRAPFDGYTDPAASAAKVLVDAFKRGDQWFDTGDLVRRQGWRHIAFAARLGDTFRWKGENVATTEVEAALIDHPDVEEAVVYGVPIPGTDGKAGMVALQLRASATFDGRGLARHVLEGLPPYAVPLFLRLVEEVERTSTFKSRKVELRNEAYDPDRVGDPLYVLADREQGYVPSYPGYAGDVASSAVRI